MATQKQVISWLEDIIPEIKSTRDPEGVMLKFARSKNLAPSQLEKLAHVYNAAKTLNFLEKSANRGDKFHVVNAEDLVSKYASAAPAEVKSIDEDNWLDKAASVQDHASFPKPTVKSAWTTESVYSVEPDTAREKIRNYLAEKEATRRNLETHRNLAYDTKAEAAEKLASLVEKLRSTPDLDFAAIERDALYVNSANKQACDLIASSLAKHMSVKRASDAGKKRLVQTHGIISEISALQDSLEVAKSASVLLEEFQKQAMTGVGSGTGTGLAGQPVKKPKRQAGGTYEGSDTKSNDIDYAKALDPIGLVDIAKGISVPRFPGDPAGLVGNLIADSLSGNKNRDQEHVDRELDDLQAQTVVERLMYTDPIISQAEPEAVVSLANSIRERAPDLARDINAMRAQLRESLQYGSMPMMTVKDLAGIQKTIGDNASTQGELKRDKYSISGTRTFGGKA